MSSTRSSRPHPPKGADKKAPPSEPTFAAPKPVRPAKSLLQAPAPQWTDRPSPPGYTSFPPPPSPAPASAKGGSPAPRGSATGSSAGNNGNRSNLRSPGPNALTSFPPPPPTPPQTDEPSYFPKGAVAPAPSSQLKKSTSASATSTTSKTKSQTTVSQTELRPGRFDIDNLEETLQNLRFAPSPMLSTIYSVPSTPREELSTPDFTASTTSCFTPPSTNPTPEPVVLTPRALPPQEPLTSPTRPRANSRRATPPSRKRDRGVVACVDTPVTFPSTWYTHPTAPDFPICSRCYEDHLLGTRFENDFRGKLCEDKKPRACRFSKPRVRDHLLQQALITGRIDDLTAYLRLRSAVPDCRGTAGVPGSEGTKWLRPKNNAVPNMVVCRACYDDHIQPFRCAANFEPASSQPASDVWACDLAIPYIRNIYKTQAADAHDWKGFTAAAASRMAITPCAKRQKVAVGSREWFTPSTGSMRGVLICAACYHDHVLLSGEEHRWRPAGDNLASRYGSMVHCTLGHFNIGIAMSRAQETRDFAIFWKALDTAVHADFCSPAGIRDGTWYTFPSHPPSFSICAACVATVAEPLGLAASLVPTCGVAAGTTHLCALNPAASPRFAAYLAKLLEGFFIADTRPLETYALEFASLPLCPRDEDAQNRRWYGWKDCTICPACYHEFARGTALAPRMQLKGETAPVSLMCEMYSPRMRALYVEACAKGDPAELLKASRKRREVYVETVPVIREAIDEAQMALGRRRLSNVAGSPTGSVHDISIKGAFSGASQQPASLAAGLVSGSKALVIEKLEKRWREVE
ncbi:hypothetical protein CGCA056_v000202 [Colletotrichum aenigma]|uniref:uncharacterized protein n=1 Tax=Colletotrichum aenigma TaxID=1215731 RepID=UPI001872B54E|nr:uncharacterized protein CGCA056_v000202 [Colletotrichum aenigma]KAF5527150.1 hypothetical protein CGCA056_v000202 [Colletotrichum aenigma]